MRTATLLSFVMMIAAPAFADGEGLVAPSNPLGGPRWQARVEVNSTPLAIGGNTNATFGPAGGIQTTRLLGEYRLDA
ncbi:MAG: hypothetical protein HY021_01770, partial [Burkholderiales bacterium]|nr:hypothetical protein [Burkholderiales bacterium]